MLATCVMWRQYPGGQNPGIWPNPAHPWRVNGALGPGSSAAYRMYVRNAARGGQRVARLTAETTALSEARVVLASIPMPHSTLPSIAHSM